MGRVRDLRRRRLFAATILKAVRAARSRSALLGATTGLPHAPDRLAVEIVRVAREVGMEADRGEHADFYETWASLRQIQARVRLLMAGRSLLRFPVHLAAPVALGFYALALGALRLCAAGAVV